MLTLANKFTILFTYLFPGLKWFFRFRNDYKGSFIKGSFKEQLWAYQHGFYLDNIDYCGITIQNEHEYLSNRVYNELHPINKIYSCIIDNKLYLPYLLKDHSGLVPCYYYFIDRGRLAPLDTELSYDPGLIQLCKDKTRLVFKQCYSQSAHGFYLLEWINDDFYLNYNIIKTPELISFINSLDNYIVTEYVYQNKYADEINHTSINTIRLQCIWDWDKNEFFIARAFHQFGFKGNTVDNIGSLDGGILAFIDIPTGKIKDTGVIKAKGSPYKVIRITKHPQSEKIIAGVQIPFWAETINQVLSVMNNLSFLKYAGIDLVITNGSFKILEINSKTTLADLQVEEGLLKDARIKRFFTNIINQE